MSCKICGKQLVRNQKSTCSLVCRAKYVNSINAGKPSPFKGKKNRWSAEQKKKIGDAQRGKPKSDAFKKKCSDRMKGLPSFFKVCKQSEKQKAINYLDYWNN